MVAMLVSGALAAPATALTTASVTAADASWIMSAQTADGAIATYPDQQFVSPYLANLAAIGLARAATATGVATSAEPAWRWLSCDQASLNAAGFVTG